MLKAHLAAWLAGAPLLELAGWAVIISIGTAAARLWLADHHALLCLGCGFQEPGNFQSAEKML